MRVLEINSGCGIRSTGKICAEIATQLITQGHESMVAYGRGNVPEKYRPIAYRMTNNVDVLLHVGVSRILDNNGLMSKGATRRFTSWIDSYNPDIIHLHNIHGYYINYRILFDYLADRDKPVVWTFHDCWPFTAKCGYFDFSRCDKWKTGCQDCPQKNEYPSSLLADRSRDVYALKKELISKLKRLYIVTPSDWLGSLVKESFLSHRSVQIIHNGIDLDIFQPRKSNFREQYNINDNEVVALGVASVWSKRKGLDDYIKFISQAEAKTKLVLVGISKKDAKLLPDNVIVVESTESALNLAEIYSAADVFVNFTYEDNYPTVNMEAIACGTPVITYNTGGSPESIDKNCGYVVPKGEYRINNEIQKIMHCSSDYCREYAQHEHSKDKMHSQYISLFKNIL